MNDKFKFKIILMFTFSLMLILPITNLSQVSDFNKFKIRIRTLYNTDVLVLFVQKNLYPFGISLNSSKVYIGKEDWLFLGDYYSNAVSKRRQGFESLNKVQVEQTIKTIAQLELLLKNLGVSHFSIMIGPDKETIYPEFLPIWARPKKLTILDSILLGAPDGLVFDSRGLLIEAKSRYEDSLYYKTDTHWNNLGAWITFEAFIRNLSKSASPQLNFFSDDEILTLKSSARRGGDLARFLRLEDCLDDREPEVKINLAHDFKSQKSNYEVSLVDDALLLAETTGALNQKKVLWLTDSFGLAVSPFMYASFSEVLEIHYSALSGNTLKELIEGFEPDFVLMTIVERNLLELNIFNKKTETEGID